MSLEINTVVLGKFEGELPPIGASRGDLRVEVSYTPVHAQCFHALRTASPGIGKLLHPRRLDALSLAIYKPSDHVRDGTIEQIGGIEMLLIEAENIKGDRPVLAAG